MKRVWQCIGLAGVLVTLNGGLAAQESAGGLSGTAEGLVRDLYDLVTFEAGTTPDWDAVRAAFLDEAVIVLRTSREATSVFSVEGFIGDWLRFIEQSNVDETGFAETILKTHTTVMKDMASVMVLYEAHIPGRDRRQRGVDIFLLVRQADGWKIAAVTNEIPTPDHPIPDVLEP